MIWLIVILAIVLVIAIAAVLLYNNLVRLRNRVDNAWAQVEVQLKRRWDLIPNLVETVKGYAAHERETFEAVTQARTRAQQAGTPAETAQAEGILGAALGRLFAVAEAYPELQADENFRQLQDELAETENRVAVSRQVYNDSVLTFNNAIQTFPGLVLAGPFGFSIREFFEVEEEAQRRGPGRRASVRQSSSLARSSARAKADPFMSRRFRETRRVKPVAGLATRRCASSSVLRRSSRWRSRQRRSRRRTTWSLPTSRLGSQPDGAVAVEEAITVSFGGGFPFTYGFREIPYRRGERISDVVVLENGSAFAPGASTELEPGGPPNTVRSDRPRWPSARRLAVPGTAIRRARSRSATASAGWRSATTTSSTST